MAGGGGGEMQKLRFLERLPLTLRAKEENTPCPMGRAQTACCQSSFMLEQGKATKPEIASVPSCLRHHMSLQNLPLSFFRSSGV